MSDNNSILDKLIENKIMQEASQFNPSDVLSNLFKNLSQKERDILNRRFGLLGKEAETLEQIGSIYQITRERIRQIEMATIRRLKEMEDFKKEIETAEHNVSRLLHKHGGVMEENHLLKELLSFSDTDQTSQQAALFILSQLLDQKIDRVKGDEDIHDGWKLPSVSLESLKEALSHVNEIIEKEDRLLKLEDLLGAFTGRDFFKQNQGMFFPSGNLPQDTIDIADEEFNRVINSYLTISRKINQNILGEWGLSRWTTIRPKRMGDKIYLILRQIGKPMHFSDIATAINEAGFDLKKAYPATIHNELILDDRYVLVGRGIYALKEWGYEPGTVIDIVSSILASSPVPLSKDAIITKVLEQRMVRKSTILLALANKEKFKRLPDGTYTLNS
jgi:hypothetical protein